MLKKKILTIIFVVKSLKGFGKNKVGPVSQTVAQRASVDDGRANIEKALGECLVFAKIVETRQHDSLAIVWNGCLRYILTSITSDLSIIISWTLKDCVHCVPTTGQICTQKAPY